MSNLWSREPALIIGVVMAALDVAIVFGLDLTPEQKAALVALVTAIGMLFTRSQVYAPATVAELEAGDGDGAVR